eukprot:gnl/Chilomastix_cuspidata/2055.p1 GENE.gnl/Chilomastix_cuspidata/2055~~gnl/Chilomastix_cuspidata/2055.p1  ORF type:complete len:473 (-),score=59.40 gnl/Chilomastix_cuspidata/2055:619-2013(-)
MGFQATGSSPFNSSEFIESELWPGNSVHPFNLFAQREDHLYSPVSSQRLSHTCFQTRSDSFFEFPGSERATSFQSFPLQHSNSFHKPFGPARPTRDNLFIRVGAVPSTFSHKTLKILTLHNLPSLFNFKEILFKAKLFVLPAQYNLLQRGGAAPVPLSSPTLDPSFIAFPELHSAQFQKTPEPFVGPGPGWEHILGFFPLEADSPYSESSPGNYSAFIFPRFSKRIEAIERRVRKAFRSIVGHQLQTRVIQSIPVPEDPNEQIIVKNVNYRATDENIIELLRIRGVAGLQSFTRNRDRNGNFTGLLYFRFKTVADAHVARRRLHGFMFLKRKLRTEFKHTKKTKMCIRIRNLTARLRDPVDGVDAIIELNAIAMQGIAWWEFCFDKLFRGVPPNRTSPFTPMEFRAPFFHPPPLSLIDSPTDSRRETFSSHPSYSTPIDFAPKQSFGSHDLVPKEFLLGLPQDM